MIERLEFERCQVAPQEVRIASGKLVPMRLVRALRAVRTGLQS